MTNKYFLLPSYDQKVLARLSHDTDLVGLVHDLYVWAAVHKKWEDREIVDSLEAFAVEKHRTMSDVCTVIRMALSGTNNTPPIGVTLELFAAIQSPVDILFRLRAMLFYVVRYVSGEVDP